MPKRSSLSFAESAISDLEEVIAWSTEQGIPETGRKLVEKVIVQTERLTLYPDSGRVVPELFTLLFVSCIAARRGRFLLFGSGGVNAF